MAVDLSRWSSDPVLEEQVAQEFQTALDAYRAKPNLVLEHANHEESIRTGGYSNRTILELIQNAADALSGAGAGDPGRVEVVVDAANEVLYCANSGAPFNSAGLTSIAMAYNSSKRGAEIGRFGLGFKSVLAVSDHPQVFSRSVSFEFGSDEAVEALSGIASSTARLPVLRTPTSVDFAGAAAGDPLLAELGEWAVTVVRLPGIKKISPLIKEIQGFNAEFLLFVDAVREIRVRILGLPGAGEDLDATYRSVAIDGEGLYRIKSDGGEATEWLVSNAMHKPSPEARELVGQAVAREAFKITVALPRRRSDLRIGRFWSYFPLQDTTTASALFNAPWSVNDDRTTMLNNDYNREILVDLAEMFVGLLPRLSTPDDPAAHFDYMTARGREALSLGDELLSHHVPRIAAANELIPDASGRLCGAEAVLPLDLGIRLPPQMLVQAQQAWVLSQNTPDNVPHWSCYASQPRLARLRDLYVLGLQPDWDGRDSAKGLGGLPMRGVLSWLREWAEGEDLTSAANALRFVLQNRSIEELAAARVIPTTAGMRSLDDWRTVFLRGVDDVVLDDAEFVLPALLAEPGIEKALRDRRFRDLDDEAILGARLAQRSPEPVDEELELIWDAVMSLRTADAVRIIRGEEEPLPVPTLGGGWSLPQQVIDIDGFSGPSRMSMLDSRRCEREVAWQLGVVHAPIRAFSVDDEPTFRDYLAGVTSGRSGDSLEINRNEGPGPFSALFDLQQRDPVRSDRRTQAWLSWTESLIREIQPDELWMLDDTETEESWVVEPPAIWAVHRAGILDTDLGLMPPAAAVSPAMVKYRGLFARVKGDAAAQIARTLNLPEELAEVPPRVVASAVEADHFVPMVDPEAIVELLMHAADSVFTDRIPMTIPARVQRTIEAVPPSSVFMAVNDEQESYLAERGRPFLRVSAVAAERLVAAFGCKDFEANFSFSVLYDGCDEGVLVFDLFTGLRRRPDASRLRHVRLSRAGAITKRVTTAEGVEDQAQEWIQHGEELVVQSGLDDARVLGLLSDAFGLGFSHADIREVLTATVSDDLQRRRAEASAAADDAERLDVYFGPDDLRDELPSGLWDALEAQGRVSEDTSVAHLFLTVYGSDALKLLADRFRELGFSDVPEEWTGRQGTVAWVRKMGFPARYAGKSAEPTPATFTVPGAVKLSDLHSFQNRISENLREVLTQREPDGRAKKAMLQLPTGAGKTRVATQTVLRLFQDKVLTGTVLWIAQSEELCEQAVRTFEYVWRGLGDERPLTISRLWSENRVSQPETACSVVVATDAKIESIIRRTDDGTAAAYEWLRSPVAVFIDEAHRAGDSKRYTEILRWLGVDGRHWDRPLVGLSATPFKGGSDSATSVRRTEALVARFGGKGSLLSPFEEEDAYRELVGLEVLARVEHKVLRGIDVELSQDERSGIEAKRLIDSRTYDRIGGSTERMSMLVEDIAALHAEHEAWPILVFTPHCPVRSGPRRLPQLPRHLGGIGVGSDEPPAAE